MRGDIGGIFSSLDLIPVTQLPLLPHEKGLQPTWLSRKNLISGVGQPGFRSSSDNDELSKPQLPSLSQVAITPSLLQVMGGLKGIMLCKASSTEPVAKHLLN